MFHYGGTVFVFDVWKGVGATLVSDQQRVALSEVPGSCGGGRYSHQATVRALASACADAFGNDRALCVLSKMDHLSARVGLLVVVG